MPPTRQTLHRSLARALIGEEADLGAFGHEDVLRFAATHGLVGLLAEHIRQGAVGGLAAETAQALAAAARDQAGHDLVLNHATRPVLDLLHEHAVPALLLKGTPIGLLYYGQGYLRLRNDVDLYIREDDARRAAALLAQQGCRVHTHREREFSSRQFHAQATAFQGVTVNFDVHYRLSNRVLFQDVMPFEDCWRQKQALPSLGPNAYAPAAGDLLLHACIHRIAHGRGSERNRLVWLYDIHLLWAAMDADSKTAFVESALARKIGAVCADALHVCDELFGTIAADAAAAPVSAGESATRGSGPGRDSEPQAPNAPRDWLSDLRRNRRHEPTSRLIHAGKPRWVVADLMALPGVRPKIAFAKELLLNR